VIFRTLIFFSRLLGHLPHRARVWLGASLGWFWFHIVRFRRETVLENMRLAFGHEKSEKQLRELAAKNFRHYGLTCIEIIVSATWRKEDYLKNVPCEGMEHLERALAKGRGAYGLNCHLGNWEWVIGSLIARGIPGDVVVKHSKNPDLDRFLFWYRAKMGSGVFYESGSVKEILGSVASGRIVGFILDQFMGPPIGLPVTFFGKEAGTAAGLALLTEKRSAPVVPMYSYRDENDRLRTVVEPELELPPLSEERIDRMYEKTQIYNDTIEKCVRRHPDQWLWLHRRWKPFRGQSRWLPSKALATSMVALVFFLAAGCVSQSTTDTPTGIAFPPEPEVNLPDVKTQVEVPAEENAEDAKGEEKKVPEVSEKEKKKNPKTAAVAKPAKVKKARVFKSDQIPFEIGERQVIALDWTALRAGEVKLEVKEGFPFKGRPTFRFTGKVLSSAVVDTIYHVDNTIESFVDKEWLLPYKFLLHMVETHQLKETRAAFDHKLNRVHYWAKRLSKKWGDELQDRQDVLAPQAVDMFTALYYARLLEFQKDKPVEFTVYENNQNLVVGLLPVANEIVQTKSGVYQCWKLAVTVKLENVLKPTGEMFLWLSDDFKKYIVKFEAKLKIGSLRGELISLRERQ
jgi:Kdo2-lipid IVA lauroyltransferase/acyltransferase